MCIGIPMQVLEPGLGWAWCDDAGARRRVDMMLVGEQPRGTWVLVFQEAAREVLGERRAPQVRDALRAMQAVMRGDPVDELFADLVGREPELPEFLRPARGAHTSTPSLPIHEKNGS